MATDLLAAAVVAWLAGAVLGLAGAVRLAMSTLALGAAFGFAAAFGSLPDGTGVLRLPTSLAGSPITFRMDAASEWLFGFGLAPALLACLLRPPAGGRGWALGAACSLIGALGVFGLQDGMALLVAWEVMSLGGAIMLLGERSTAPPGRPVLLMLGLLELGAVALLVAILLLTIVPGVPSFDALAHSAAAQPGWLIVTAGLLLLVGFGAKLGLLPFYEWFPEAYGVGSGASGALLSGVVLNAAFAALGHALLSWLPASGGSAFGFGIVVTLWGVATAILAILYAFQQDDWRRLLSLSSAENAAISVTMLGTAIVFRSEAHPELAALAWTVALLHLGGHSLTKGALFLAADGIFVAGGSYGIRHAAVARGSTWTLSVGATLAAMSLSAMPPQIGFVTEWYAFQTVFQGFRLPDPAGRLTLVLAGAGLALTAAIGLSTFVKAIGIGVFGGREPAHPPVHAGVSLAVFLLAGGGLLTAAGMPFWLGSLGTGELAMRDGLELVPLTAKFAFISPTLLVVVMPLLSLIPIGLVLAARRGRPVRRTEVWYGGLPWNSASVATTSLTFSNALRTFYGMIYRPTVELEKTDADERGYFVQSLRYGQRVRSLFTPSLFEPVTRLAQHIGTRTRALQSGNLNLYLGIIAVLLAIVLLITLMT